MKDIIIKIIDNLEAATGACLAIIVVWGIVAIMIITVLK